MKAFIYGDIGDSWDGSGSTAIELVEAFDAADGIPVDIHVNSGGGDVFEAHAMHTAILSYKGEVVVHIDGIAASAASYLGLGADRIVIAPHALMMIHKASMFTYGNANELRNSAETLETLDNSLASIYSKKTSIAADEILDLLAAETWLTAEEALEKGFVDEIDEFAPTLQAKVSKEISAHWKNAPKNAFESVVEPEEASPEDNPEPTPPAIETDTEPQDEQGNEPEDEQERVIVLDSGVYRIS